MKITTMAIGLAGIVVLLVFLAPLAAFTRYGEFQVESEVASDGTLEVRIIYHGPVHLRDAKVTLYSNGKQVAEDSDPLLEDGESLVLHVDPEKVKDQLVLELEGKIAGVYYFKYRIERGSP